MAEPIDDAVEHVLVVCTANICRSAIAAALLEQHAEHAGLDLEISSAGFMFDDEPVDPEAVVVMAERGVDIASHRSTLVSPELVAAADLVVTMERRHARQLTLEVPECSERIHTLRALVEGLDEARSATLRGRLVEVHEARPRSALLGNGPDEVEDPHEMPRRRYRRTAEEIDYLIARLVTHLSADRSAGV